MNFHSVVCSSGVVVVLIYGICYMCILYIIYGICIIMLTVALFDDR